MSNFFGGVRVLSRTDQRNGTDDLDLNGSRYGFGAAWDTDPRMGRKVDVDLQCVVVDNNGTIIDCAYYNNLKAVRAITHSGDELQGRTDKIEEMVWVNLPKLPSHVEMLIFVVAAYSGGSLNDVSNGRLHVMEDREGNEKMCIEMERSTGSVDIVSAVYRSQSGWKMRIVDTPAQEGQHFMDILPSLCGVIGGFIPSAPKRQKVAFAMEKGGVLDLPKDLNGVMVGLGWDTDEGQVDLDVSAILLNQQGEFLEAVFFGRLESIEHGIRHAGDNLTGDGDGDDEQIDVDLDRIGAAVNQVVFCVNIYTKNRTFAQVANPYCRVVDKAGGSELCRYSLRDAGSENGLIIARMAREAGGRWGFHALGLPSRGSMYKDSLPQIQALCNMKTSSLLVRGSTFDSTSAPAPPMGAAADTVYGGSMGSKAGSSIGRMVRGMFA